MAAVLVLAALIPFVVLAVRLIGRNYVALNGDDALINLRVHDVFTAHTPLLGSYERYGFNQPGPAWFYLLSIPFRVLGSRFSAIQVGVVFVHAASVVLVARVMWRRFGMIAMAWSLLVLTAVFWGLGPVSTTDPWEPHVSAVLLITTAVLAFDAISGGLAAWVWLVVVASLTTEMYATAGVIAIALVLWGMVIGFVRRARAAEPQRAAPWRDLAISAAVGVVLWLPALVEQFRDHPGNLTRTWRFTTASHVTIGLRHAFGALRLETWFPAVWLGRSVPLVPFATTVDVGRAPWFPGSIIVLAIVAIVAWRRRAVPQLLLVATVVFAALITVVALSRLSLPFYIWLVDPTRSAGALLWLPVGTLAALVTSARARSWITAVVAVGVVVFSVVFAVRAARDDLGPGRVQIALGKLARAAEPALRHGSGPVIVHSDVGDQLFAQSNFGHDELTVDFGLAGFDVVSGSKSGDRDATTRFGAFRAHPERATRELLIQVAGAKVPAQGRIVATADPLTRSERTMQAELRREVEGVCGIGDLQVLRRCRDQHAQVGPWLDRLNSIPDLPALQLVLSSVATPAA